MQQSIQLKDKRHDSISNFIFLKTSYCMIILSLEEWILFAQFLILWNENNSVYINFIVVVCLRNSKSLRFVGRLDFLMILSEVIIFKSIFLVSMKLFTRIIQKMYLDKYNNQNVIRVLTESAAHFNFFYFKQWL